MPTPNDRQKRTGLLLTMHHLLQLPLPVTALLLVHLRLRPVLLPTGDPTMKLMYVRSRMLPLEVKTWGVQVRLRQKVIVKPTSEERPVTCRVQQRAAVLPLHLLGSVLLVLFALPRPLLPASGGEPLRRHVQLPNEPRRPCAIHPRPLLQVPAAPSQPRLNFRPRCPRLLDERAVRGLPAPRAPAEQRRPTCLKFIFFKRGFVTSRYHAGYPNKGRRPKLPHLSVASKCRSPRTLKKLSLFFWVLLR